MSSLRGTIHLGYLLVAAVVLVLGLLQLGALGAIEHRIAAGEAVAGLLQDSLEMRRSEKKYFLSGDWRDLEAALAGADTAIGRLTDRRAVFVRLASADELTQLDDSLRTYRNLLARYDQISPDERVDISERARAAGHAASQTAKLLSRRDRDGLVATVQNTIWVLIVCNVPVVLLVLTGGRALAARVIRPLRALEASLGPIGAGRYTQLALPTQDREIVSFARAFNAMLEELQSRQRQLRHAERLASLGTLVSGVAHELNNPLGNISTAAQLLLEAADADGRLATQRHRIAWIDSETERARAIVRILLDHARREAPRPPQGERVSLEELMEDARAAVLPPDADATRVQLDVPPEIVLNADEERLRGVFINLLRNALAASVPGTVIRIRAVLTDWRRRPPDPAHWVLGGERMDRDPERPLALIECDDRGPGLDPAILPRIFDPFFTTRPAGQGTGLGLYIAQAIVREHDGALAAGNRSGGGARFSVWLPAEREDS